MDVSTTCLDILYNLHTENYQGEDKLGILYTKFTDDVISDGLMNKYNKEGKLKILNKTEEKLINDYYILSSKLHEKYNFECKGEYYIFYRASSPINIIDNKIEYKIPFYVSIEEKNMFNWINYKLKCCLWKIFTSMNTKFVCINNPNEGKEVVLPAGYMEIISEEYIDFENDKIKQYNVLFKAF